MTAPARIVKEYEAREEAHGGLAQADAKRICQETADSLGLSYEDVRRVMSQHWNTLGAG